MCHDHAGDLTIGMYDALSGRSQPQDSASDLTSFDNSSVSALNELMQTEKKPVEYIIKDEGGSSHRKKYICELMVDGKSMGQAEGVSKKVAKAKIAGVALRQLQQQAVQVNNDETSGDSSIATTVQAEDQSALELTGSRKRLCVLGMDIDEDLIERASKKAVQLAPGDLVQFRHGDITTSAFKDDISAFLQSAKSSSSSTERPFNLITLFSVTMWIHLNHGDDGLWKFLEQISSMTDHLIVEPQPWKCYRYIPLASIYHYAYSS